MTSVGTDSLITLQNADADNDRNILELMYLETFGKEKLDELRAKYFPQVNQTDSSSLNKSYNEDYLTEMTKSLEDNQPVSDEEITNLANERADAIKNYLLTFPNVTPERLVVKESEIFEQEDQKLIKCKLGIGSI
jgi:hypothetical protein